MAYSEDNFASPIGVAGLAHRVGVSHNHLTNLYRDAPGCTVVQSIRRYRENRNRGLCARVYRV